MMLMTDGSLYGFGDIYGGQMGNGTTGGVSAPKDTGLTGFKAIAVGGGHVVAIETGGTVKAWGWGNSDYGQIGASSLNTAEAISGLSDFTAVAAGAGTILILLENGSPLITGINGDLTNDSNEVYPGPYPLDSFAGITIEKIYGGYYRFMIIDDGGNAYCWLTEI